MSPTWNSLDIEAGRALLWPPRTRVIRPATWGDEGEEEYVIEGDELWVGGDDCNWYAKASTPDVARRMVAAWNATLGIPTERLEHQAEYLTATLRANRERLKEMRDVRY